MQAPLKIGFLASHGGSGMRAVLEAMQAGAINAVPAVMISNNVDALAHDVAAAYAMPSLTLNVRLLGDEPTLDRAIARCLGDHGAQLIVLSGYMRMLGPVTLARFRDRILNVHPALLPAFGGKGMYGDRVHAAVLAAGASVSGATVHIVDEEYDHGPVVGRLETPVLADDTLGALRARVQAAETQLFVRVIADIAAGRLDLDALARASR